MTGILQRYTLREIIGPSLLGLLVFTFLLLVTEIFKMMDLLVNSGVRPLDALELIGCVLPTLLPVTVPMAVLLGVLLGFGRMAADSEIMAIRTSGVHLFQIFWPILLLCGLISATMMWANQSLTPSLSLRAADTGLNIAFQLVSSIQPGRVHNDLGKGSKGESLYFGSRDPQTGALRDVALKLGSSGSAGEESLSGASVIVSAPEGTIETSIEDVTIRLELRNGTADIRSESRPGEYSVASFERLRHVLRMDIGRRFDTGEFKKDPEMMTVSELRQALAYAHWPSSNIVKWQRRWRVELAQRFSVPLACLAVILLGIPLGLQIKPSANTLGFAIALALTFAYYLLLQWGVSLGLSGSPLGIPMIFLPNFLLGGIGIALMIRTVRR